MVVALTPLKHELGHTPLSEGPPSVGASKSCVRSRVLCASLLGCKPPFKICLAHIRSSLRSIQGLFSARCQHDIEDNARVMLALSDYK